VPTSHTSSWLARRQGLPFWRLRQIALTERVALVAAGATVPYEAYYAIVDLRYYLSVFIVNLVFIGVCGSAVLLNRWGRFNLALDLIVGALYIQVLAVTALLSTGPGVHLFYFSLGASLGMFFVAGHERRALTLTLLAAVLFITCHFAFPPGTTALSVAPAAEHIMYATNASAAILLAGGLSFLYRLDIDRAEKDLTRSNQQLERLSGVDALTGLANRRAMDAHLTQEWSRLSRDAASVAFILCDVDHFKEFNDHYGHLAGDTCLQRVASALSAVVQRSTDLVARYGGEEFLIVLSGTDTNHVQTVVERVRAAVVDLRVSHERSAVAPVVTISAGIVLATLDELPEPEDLLHRADLALYAAKRSGRNCVVYYGDLDGTDSVASTAAV
jgi:diguanylate cyclase (GGDEF)-like protein